MTIIGSMKYNPRSCFRDIHDTPWKRAYIISFRRSGKTVAMGAEMFKRAYNGAPDGQYLFISPLAEQSEMNVYGIFQSFDDAGYITHYDKQNRIITLANGATITFGGARTAEKFRGRYLDGCIFDEYSQIPANIYSDIISFCLADRDGWVAFIGTARSDDNYRLYKGYLAYKDEPGWMTKLISWRDNPEAFSKERIEELRKEHFNYCRVEGFTPQQAEQAWLCEMECDFSFIDEGRPDMQAMFYNEIQNLFDSGRVINHDKVSKLTEKSEKIAVLDISHSIDRDYTVAWIVAETTDMPVVISCEWENNKPISYWFDRLNLLGIRTVALPFDANRTNKETLLTLNQLFKRHGFDIIKIKKLLRTEQIENGRWVLNNSQFSNDTIQAISELGKFREFKNKHGLEQDVVAAMLYAGQVLRKKDVKKELAKRIVNNYNNNKNVFNNGINVYNGVVI